MTINELKIKIDALVANGNGGISIALATNNRLSSTDENDLIPIVIFEITQPDSNWKPEMIKRVVIGNCTYKEIGLQLNKIEEY
jgi:hypothetical protein